MWGRLQEKKQAPEHRRERNRELQEHCLRPMGSVQVSEGWWRQALPPMSCDVQGGIVDTVYPGLPGWIRTLEAQQPDGEGS